MGGVISGEISLGGYLRLLIGLRVTRVLRHLERLNSADGRQAVKLSVDWIEFVCQV